MVWIPSLIYVLWSLRPPYRGTAVDSAANKLVMVYTSFRLDWTKSNFQGFDDFTILGDHSDMAVCICHNSNIILED